MNKDIFFQDKENCKIPFTHLADNITDSSLKILDELYGAADVLSVQNAIRHKRIILILSVLGTLITFSFLLYDEAELHGLILACIVMVFFLFLVRKMAKTSKCHKKYLEYRVLAETIRIQYFLSIAGIEKRVSNLLPWFTKKSLPWVEEILESLPAVHVNEKQSILDCWVRDQKAYHEGALIKAGKNRHRQERIMGIVIFITIIAYIVTLLFEIYVYSYPIDVDVNVVRACLKIIVGTMSAITLFTDSYYGKMSLDTLIDDYERMISLYEKVESDIMENGESEELILYLAREFLIENSTWYAYQCENTANIVL